MGANWLIRGSQKQINRVMADIANNQLDIDRSKDQLVQVTGETLTSPLGLVGCFSAGCLTEWAVESETGHHALQWSSLVTTGLTLANDLVGNWFQPTGTAQSEQANSNTASS